MTLRLTSLVSRLTSHVLERGSAGHLLAVFLVGDLDKVLEVVIGGARGEFKCRPVAAHKIGDHFIVIGTGQAFDQPFVKAAVNKLIPLFLLQPFAKALHAFVLFELEKPDDLLHVKANTRGRNRGHGFQRWPPEVESPGIITAVLQRVFFVVAGADLYLPHHIGLQVQGNIKLPYVGNLQYGVFGGRLAQVRKPDRVLFANRDDISAGGIGHAHLTAGALHGYPLDGKHPGAVVHKTFHPVLGGSVVYCQGKEQKEEKTNMATSIFQAMGK